MTRAHSIARSAALSGAAALLLGAAWQWAARASAIVLDLGSIICF